MFEVIHIIVALLIFHPLRTASQCQYSTNPSLCSRLSTNCLAITTDCPLTISSCAFSYCALCTSLGITPSVEPCYAASRQTACFNDLLLGQVPTETGSIATITDLPPPPACLSARSIFETCWLSTANFLELEFSSQFSCLCSSSGVLATSRYDGYTSTCLAWLSTYSPARYLTIGQYNGKDLVRTPCEHFIKSPAAFPTTSALPSARLTTPAPTTPSDGSARNGSRTSGAAFSSYRTTDPCRVISYASFIGAVMIISSIMC